VDTRLEQIGGLIMVGIPGPELDRGTVELHRKLPFAGVVLFRRNWADARKLRRLTAQIHALRRDDPPLVAIDHEGGRVCRLAEPFTPIPPALELAKRGEGAVKSAGKIVGRELREAGIDINFAPVLDINTNSANPVIGERAFGKTAKLVAQLGTAFFQAMQREGVIPCGKHFPGHGDTSEDSHLTLPRVSRTRTSLMRRELLPFRHAIQHGIPMLMSAHVLYPAFDPRRPATLSPVLMTELLRQKLGFRGVLCSDDLEMRAVSRNYRPAEIAIMAVAAGVDLLLFCHSQERALQAAHALLQALERDELSRERIDEALERLARCRTRRRAER